jgi:hypothetical protein
MGFFQMGSYVIGNLNQGYSLSWQDSTGHRHRLDCDVEKIISDYIGYHYNEIVRLLYLLDDPNPTLILDDEHGARVINWIPNSHTIPGETLEGDKLREFHHRGFLEGYNRAFETSFTYEMIKERLWANQ